MESKCSNCGLIGFLSPWSNWGMCEMCGRAIRIHLEDCLERQKRLVADTELALGKAPARDTSRGLSGL